MEIKSIISTEEELRKILGQPSERALKKVISSFVIYARPFIPGLGETLRINGRAYITNDEEILKEMQANGRNPLLGIVVEIEECYIHCAKAFIRSKMWESESWLNKKELPSAAKMLLEHAKVNTSEEDVARSLEESYTKLYQ